MAEITIRKKTKATITFFFKGKKKKAGFQLIGPCSPNTRLICQIENRKI